MRKGEKDDAGGGCNVQGRAKESGEEERRGIERQALLERRDSISGTSVCGR